MGQDQCWGLIEWRSNVRELGRGREDTEQMRGRCELRDKLDARMTDAVLRIGFGQRVHFPCYKNRPQTVNFEVRK